ncbi:MAG: Phosphoesterase PA-phosphatase [Pseudonocardiales bacterium]|nr:Phosphoesterase PA-phosphatase [Pseudonocardiales bacterium]
MLASIAVGLAVTADVLAGGLLTRLDHQISHLTRDDWGLRFRAWPRRGLRVLTVFGQRGPVLIVAVPFVAWLAWRIRRVEPLLRLLAALVVLTASVYAIKFGIGRNAPPADVLHTKSGQSFPSGHVANAILVWGLLTWLAARHTAAIPKRVAAALNVVRIAGPLLVVLGMTLLDYHWLTDFIAGAALGVVLLWIVTWPIPSPERPRAARPSGIRPSAAP